MANESLEAQVFFLTVRIAKVQGDEPIASIGTGYLLYVPIEGFPDRGVLLAISNRHIVSGTPNSATLVFHRVHSDDPSRPSFTDFISMSGELVQPSYFGDQSHSGCQRTTINKAGVPGRDQRRSGSSDRSAAGTQVAWRRAVHRSN